MTKLEYFKSKILNHLHSLEEKENQEVSKSMYVDFLCKTMTDPFYMAKANYGVGHISTYSDGSMWKKVQSNPPKWRCVRQGKNYTQENKGAKIALSRLISKVEKATSTDELLEVVMFNIDRFRDEKGNVLDFVKELKKHVESKKQGLNKKNVKIVFKKKGALKILDKKELHNFIEKHKTSKDNERVSLGNIPNAAKERIFEKTGINVNRVILDSDSVRHAYRNKNHNLLDNDLDDMFDIITTTNDIELSKEKTKKANNPVIVFKQEKPNGVILLEEFRSYKGELELLTAYRVKKEKSTLGFTSETEQTPNAAASNADNSSITDDGKKSRDNQKYIDMLTSKGASFDNAKKTVEKIDKIIQDKDYIDIFSWLENKENKIARMMFEDIAGQKIGKTKEDLRTALINYIGKEKLLENKYVKSMYDNEYAEKAIREIFEKFPNRDKYSLLIQYFNLAKKEEKKVFRKLNSDVKELYLVGCRLLEEEIFNRFNNGLFKSFTSQVNYFKQELEKRMCI